MIVEFFGGPADGLVRKIYNRLTNRYCIRHNPAKGHDENVMFIYRLVVTPSGKIQYHFMESI